MKSYIFLLSLMFLGSCSSEEPTSKDDRMVGYLTSGKWEVVEFDGKKNRLELGVVFSKDKQFFNLDSQGRIVPTSNEKVFEIKNDTLRIVDFKYEQKFLEKKGTLIFKVKELNDSKMILNSVYPDSMSVYKLEKEEW